MKRLICAFRGHNTIRVRQVAVIPRPGGILPSIDGRTAFAIDPDGDDRACVRCMAVLS